MSIKCAEIYFSNSGNFTFTCTLCKENFFKAIILAEHMIDNHFFSIYPDALKSPFLVDDNELKTIRELFAIKKDICLEDSSCVIAKEVQQSIEFEFEKLQSVNDNFSIANISVPQDSLAEEIVSDILKQDEKISNILIENTDDIPKILPILNNISTKNNIKTKMVAEQKSNLKRKNNTNISLSSLYWKCHICSKTIRKESRRRHLDNLHLSKKYRYKCRFCVETFLTQGNREIHTREQHTGGPERPYKCHQCDNKYKIIYYLREHIKRAHLKLRNNKCNFCEKTFFTKVEATRHEINQHSLTKPHVCEICGLAYTTTQLYRNHKRRHAEPTFQCSKCDKKFHVQRSLKKHEICHSKYKPYECKICLRRFPRLSSYKAHMVLHTGIRDFICKICGKEFLQASGIRCHMKCHGIEYKACNVIRKSQTANEEV